MATANEGLILVKSQLSARRSRWRDSRLQCACRSHAPRVRRKHQQSVLVRAFTERPEVAFLLTANSEGLVLVSQRHRTTMLASRPLSQGLSSVCKPRCRVSFCHGVLCSCAKFPRYRTCIRLSFPVILLPSLPDKLANGWYLANKSAYTLEVKGKYIPSQSSHLILRACLVGCTSAPAASIQHVAWVILP